MKLWSVATVTKDRPSEFDKNEAATEGKKIIKHKKERQVTLGYQQRRQFKDD